MGISNLDFGHSTTATQAAEALSGYIKGKTILITGVSPNGISAALAAALSAHDPALLILASRTRANIEAVARDVSASHPGVRVEVVVVDFSSLGSVRRAAGEVRRVVLEGSRGSGSRSGSGSGRGGIDVLFNNAGINISERRMTEEGIEMQFGTNHIGPFLFTNLLLDLLILRPSSLAGASNNKRIVNTSSEAHRVSPVRFSDWNLDPGKAARGEVAKEDEPRRGMPKGILRGGGVYEPSVAYGQSKTANVLFSVGLNERLRKTGIKSFAVMPGTIMTGLTRGMDEEYLKSLLQGSQDWKTLDQGAATLVVAGFDPGLNDEEGVYLDDCQMRRPSKWAGNARDAERLWKLSEDLVGAKFGYQDQSRL